MSAAHRGFTLIEMLLAVAALAMLSALATAGFVQLARAHGVRTEQGARLAQLQRTDVLLTRDLVQADARPAREGSHGSLEPAMVGGAAPALVALTSAGWRNPIGAPRGPLQRIEYVLDRGVLQRRAWQVLDRAPDSVPLVQQLIDEVGTAEVAFLGPDGWAQSWPPAGAAPEALPRAVKLVLVLEDLGRVERIVELPGAVD